MTLVARFFKLGVQKNLDDSNLPPAFVFMVIEQETIGLAQKKNRWDRARHFEINNR